MKVGKIKEQLPPKSVHLSGDCQQTAHQLLTDSSLTDEQQLLDSGRTD